MIPVRSQWGRYNLPSWMILQSSWRCRCGASKFLRRARWRSRPRWGLGTSPQASIAIGTYHRSVAKSCPIIGDKWKAEFDYHWIIIEYVYICLFRIAVRSALGSCSGKKRLCSASLLPHLCIDVVEVTIRCLNVLEQLYMVSFWIPARRLALWVFDVMFAHLVGNDPPSHGQWSCWTCWSFEAAILKS